MLAFLFITLIIAALAASYYLTDKISSQRKQILLLKYQNDSLKNNSAKDIPKDIEIKYITPSTPNGSVQQECILYLAPIKNSITINTIEENTYIQIHDSAEVAKELWYEVSLIGSNRINSKGWVKSNYINLEKDIS